MAFGIGTSSINTGTGTAVSVAKPAGAAVGNLCVVHVSAKASLTVADNNGAEAFAEDVENPAGGAVTTAVYSRVLTGDEGSTLNFTLSTSADWAAAAFLVTDPNETHYDATPVVTDDFDSSPDVLGITTVTDGAIHVIGAGSAWGSATYSAVPDGYTEIENNSGSGQTLVVAYKVIPTAGATGTQEIIHSNSTWHACYSLALRPGTGGGGATTRRYSLPLTGVG